jgi:hypothetical protein
MIEPDGPHVDLAEAGGDRTHRRLRAGRQALAHLGDALVTWLRAK